MARRTPMAERKKLTKADIKLLRDVWRCRDSRRGGFYLRDMRRNRCGIKLERLGLVDRDWPEPTGIPGKHRILMRITDAGRAALSSQMRDGRETDNG